MLVLLRFCDPDNDKRFVGEEAERYWMGGDQPGGVDLYVGGTEHAVLHLLYARSGKKCYSTWVTSRSPNRSSGCEPGNILGEDNQKMSNRAGTSLVPTT